MQKLPERDGPDALKRSPRNDQPGIALIHLIATLPIIVGPAQRAVDVSRSYALDSSPPHRADAIALAMAAELGHRSNALTLAVRAMGNPSTSHVPGITCQRVTEATSGGAQSKASWSSS